MKTTIIKPPEIITEVVEEKEKEKYKVIVLTARPKEDKTDVYHTSSEIEKEAKKLGISVYLLFLEGAYLRKDEDGNRTVHNDEDEEGFAVSSKDTIAIVRGGIDRREIYKDLLSQIENAGISTVNSRDCIEICSDKYRTTLMLADAGLRTPTTVLVPNEKGGSLAFDKLNSEYPVILKTNTGAKGVGVLFVESERGLESMIQLLYKMDENIALLLQSYIKTEFDVRVMIINNKIIGAMRRNVVEGDFRSNYSQGATIEEYELSDIERENCIRAAKIVGGSWVGVDFIPAKDEEDQPFILEVNSSPGTKGFRESTKINTIKKLLETYNDKSNWWNQPTLCGVWETFEHEIFGSLVGKMDTGNSGKASVIHSDNFEIKNKDVIWSLNGKKVKSKLMDTRDIKVGDETDTRPMIELDLKFQQTIHKYIFTLDDRGDRTTPLLMNKNFMTELNLAVDPSRKFILTERIDE
tara:strand:+ start:105 stop:1502 length:1398 start_codon:yes stop_codon:yes gene_type:complete